MRTPSWLVVLAGMLAGLGSTRAGEPREHDRGFFLHGSVGGGYAESGFEERLLDLKLEGAAGDGVFAVGYMIRKNLAVHGTAFGWIQSSPDLKLNDQKQDLEDVTVQVSAFGPGVTYYLGPSNVFVTGAVGVAEASVEKDNVIVKSDAGWAFEAAAGKEWWISGKWGIGVELGAGYHSIPADRLPDDLTGFNLGLRFSATMN